MARGNNHARSKEHLPSTDGLWDTTKHTEEENKAYKRELIKNEQTLSQHDQNLLAENAKFGPLHEIPQSPSRLRHASK